MANADQAWRSGDNCIDGTAFNVPQNWKESQFIHSAPTKSGIDFMQPRVQYKYSRRGRSFVAKIQDPAQRRLPKDKETVVYAPQLTLLDFYDPINTRLERLSDMLITVQWHLEGGQDAYQRFYLPPLAAARSKMCIAHVPSDMLSFSVKIEVAP